ncbi:MAG TPA: hypothetical protein PK950_01130 [Candidatus Paceibacterota bacterium]|nr:hypothetical protein [Candidatus Paceibacterota bacterium]
MNNETSTTKQKAEPLHEVCITNVDKPTLVARSKSGVDVWLQWFGKSERFDLSDKQFLFPVDVPAVTFFGRPEEFEVIMVGPVKNWPNKDAINELIVEYGADTIVVYLISSAFGVDGGNGQAVPASCLIPLKIKLADDNCGIIDPVDFYDDNVRIKAIERFFESKK